MHGIRVLLFGLFPGLLLCLGGCSVERWSVKTGSDLDAGLVNLHSDTPTTVAALRALKAPSVLPANRRIRPTETTQFVLSATLREYKLAVDSDYHLVIADSKGNTMIAEIPDPAALASGSRFMHGIQVARTEFDHRYLATSIFRTVNVPVCLRGIGFFDFHHDQTGMAPNAIEIHPVLDIQFNVASCPAGEEARGAAAQAVANDSVRTSVRAALRGTL